MNFYHFPGRKWVSLLIPTVHGKVFIDIFTDSFPLGCSHTKINFSMYNFYQVFEQPMHYSLCNSTNTKSQRKMINARQSEVLDIPKESVDKPTGDSRFYRKQLCVFDLVWNLTRAKTFSISQIEFQFNIIRLTYNSTFHSVLFFHEFIIIYLNFFTLNLIGIIRLVFNSVYSLLWRKGWNGSGLQ